MPSTPETKDSIKEESLMRMQKGVTLINTAYLEGCTRQRCLRFSVRLLLHLQNAETAEASRFAYTEQLSIILSCPHQTRSLLNWLKDASELSARASSNKRKLTVTSSTSSQRRRRCDPALWTCAMPSPTRTRMTRSQRP